MEENDKTITSPSVVDQQYFMMQSNSKLFNELNNSDAVTMKNNEKIMHEKEEIEVYKQNLKEKIVFREDLLKNFIKFLLGRIVFENDDFLVIDKPLNVSCKNTFDNTISLSETKTINYSINQLLPAISSQLYGTKFDPLVPLKFQLKNFKLKLGHRLDRQTTGVLILTKNERIHHSLHQHFLKRSVNKQYFCLTKNIPSFNHGIIELPLKEEKLGGRYKTMVCSSDETLEFNTKKNQLTNYEIDKMKEKLLKTKKFFKNSKEAITKFKVVDFNESAYTSLMELQPITGVKHQLRSHLAYGLMTPILGDHKYSHYRKNLPQKLNRKTMELLQIRETKVRNLPMFLHSNQLLIPNFNGMDYKFSAPFPKEFLRFKFKMNDEKCLDEGDEDDNYWISTSNKKFASAIFDDNCFDKYSITHSVDIQSQTSGHSSFMSENKSDDSIINNNNNNKNKNNNKDEITSERRSTITLEHIDNLKLKKYEENRNRTITRKKMNEPTTITRTSLGEIDNQMKRISSSGKVDSNSRMSTTTISRTNERRVLDNNYFHDTMETCRRIIRCEKYSLDQYSDFNDYNQLLITVLSLMDGDCIIIVFTFLIQKLNVFGFVELIKRICQLPSPFVKYPNNYRIQLKEEMKCIKINSNEDRKIIHSIQFAINIYLNYLSLDLNDMKLYYELCILLKFPLSRYLHQLIINEILNSVYSNNQFSLNNIFFSKYLAQKNQILHQRFLMKELKLIRVNIRMFQQIVQISERIVKDFSTIKTLLRIRQEDQELINQLDNFNRLWQYQLMMENYLDKQARCFFGSLTETFLRCIDQQEYIDEHQHTFLQIDMVRKEFNIPKELFHWSLLRSTIISGNWERVEELIKLNRPTTFQKLIDNITTVVKQTTTSSKFNLLSNKLKNVVKFNQAISQEKHENHKDSIALSWERISEELYRYDAPNRLIDKCLLNIADMEQRGQLAVDMKRNTIVIQCSKQLKRKSILQSYMTRLNEEEKALAIELLNDTTIW
ncbi:hypothetical protein SNEBB_006790 [Seison nebaliae]|nr:hypothetical protein SNEBB_006790 [Seison nebaliae]